MNSVRRQTWRSCENSEETQWSERPEGPWQADSEQGFEGWVRLSHVGKARMADQGIRHQEFGAVRELASLAVNLEFALSSREPVKEFICGELTAVYSWARCGSTFGHRLAAGSGGLGRVQSWAATCTVPPLASVGSLPLWEVTCMASAWFTTHLFSICSSAPWRVELASYRPLQSYSAVEIEKKKKNPQVCFFVVAAD